MDLIFQQQKSLKACNDYLRTKNERKIMKLSKTSNGYERYMLAKDAKESIEKTIKALDGIIEKNNRRNGYKDRFATFKDVCRSLPHTKSKTKNFYSIKKF
ncbi:MAG: hypothetical protein K6B68_10735 [Eubacterium sp.]|nr:hypothetical protein [Eubacterium sp.]